MRHIKSDRKDRKVQVSFTAEQWKLIEQLKGVMGVDYAEIVRNIVLAWLSEKSMISSAVKVKRLGELESDHV
ncbi:MAG: hypothetical protein QXS32_08280 [Candidatus Nezhaarchaeales archaeon]